VYRNPFGSSGAPRAAAASGEIVAGSVGRTIGCGSAEPRASAFRSWSWMSGAMMLAREARLFCSCCWK